VCPRSGRQAEGILCGPFPLQGNELDRNILQPEPQLTEPGVRQPLCSPQNRTPLPPFCMQRMHCMHFSRLKQDPPPPPKVTNWIRTIPNLNPDRTNPRPADPPAPPKPHPPQFACIACIAEIDVSEGLSVTIITIRNLDEETKDRLRMLAAMHRHSMEAEIREILRCSVRDNSRPAPDPQPLADPDRLSPPAANQPIPAGPDHAWDREDPNAAKVRNMFADLNRQFVELGLSPVELPQILQPK
jgi:plasmid stability protein